MFPITLRKVAGLVSAPAIIATLVVATAAAPTMAATSAKYFNGFENAGDRTEAKQMFNVTPVPSGNGLNAASGGWYAIATPNASVFSRLGGYSDKFPAGGYTVSVDIYLDMTEAIGTDKRFDWTSAPTDGSGGYGRDFVFNVGTNPADDGEFLVSASNNADWPAGSPYPHSLTISESGWYTFEHNFRNASGVLAVDMSVSNKAGTVLKEWTLSDSRDIIGQTVGGNRYGWLATNDFSELALDNLTKVKN